MVLCFTNTNFTSCHIHVLHPCSFCQSLYSCVVCCPCDVALCACSSLSTVSLRKIGVDSLLLFVTILLISVLCHSLFLPIESAHEILCCCLFSLFNVIAPIVCVGVFCWVLVF